MRLTKRLVLAIIKDLRHGDKAWDVAGNAIYFASEDEETVINITKGFLGRIKVYYNGWKIPIWSPVLKLRLRFALRKFILQKALQLVELE